MDAFGTVLIAVAVVAALAAAVSYRGSGRAYREIGRAGALSTGDDAPADPLPAAGAVAGAEAREEIRQLLEAKSARRAARGEPPLDVRAELAALTGPEAARPPATDRPGSAEPGRQPATRTGSDEALRREVRQLVTARNERRARKGREPLDVEAEVERRLRELGG